MQSDRRAILTLVALGRITPAEAERLLLAYNADRGSIGIMVITLTLACFAQFDLHALSMGATQVAHHVLPQLTDLFGGIL